MITRFLNPFYISFGTDLWYTFSTILNSGFVQNGKLLPPMLIFISSQPFPFKLTIVLSACWWSYPLQQICTLAENSKKHQNLFYYKKLTKKGEKACWKKDIFKERHRIYMLDFLCWQCCKQVGICSNIMSAY